MERVRFKDIEKGLLAFAHPILEIYMMGEGSHNILEYRLDLFLMPFQCQERLHVFFPKPFWQMVVVVQELSPDKASNAIWDAFTTSSFQG